jgi:hypothetical protein
MFKASWIQSTLCDYRLDGPAIREPNLEMMASFDTNDLCLSVC